MDAVVQWNRTALVARTVRFSGLLGSEIQIVHMHEALKISFEYTLMEHLAYITFTFLSPY